MTTDLTSIFIWWFTFFILGTVSLPLTWYFFRKFFDRGYAFSKSIGLLTISYLAFFFGIIHILPFTKGVLMFFLMIIASFNFYLLNIFKKEIVKDIKENYRVIILQEALFVVGLLFLSYVRAHQPDILGLEKLMDYGFINSILRSKWLPPPDMWFAGESINYYWFGHFMVSVATKLSNIPSSITYNLMLATILALILTGVFSIVSTLIEKFSDKFSKRQIALFALTSAILVNFGGNFHTSFYVLKNGVDKYWYPDATRFIGYNPETEDKTIHEFPIYSYVVSDLHAHLINLPFVILFIAFLWILILDFDKKRFRPASIFPIGFLLGIFFMTNAWDFANYSLLTAVLFAVYILIKHKLNVNFIKTTIKYAVPILLISLITLLPFYLNFESLAEGVKFVHSRTPLWQLLILWGFPLILTTGFLSIIVRQMKKINITDLFILSILITSWILIILPEIIFVKDIYIASHYRANTMFKLTYQAFVLSYLSSGYVFIRIMSSIKDYSVKIIFVLSSFLILFSLVSYSSIAINSYYAKLQSYKGLNGVAWADTQIPERSELIKWFNQNIKGQPVILEAPGDSYTEFNIVSSYTGLPTVSGWFVHEWLWRGASTFPQNRVTDISQIYTSNDIGVTKALLEKYDVEYVIIGSQERQKFPGLYENKFSQLGIVVFSSETAKVYKLN